MSRNRWILFIAAILLLAGVATWASQKQAAATQKNESSSPTSPAAGAPGATQLPRPISLVVVAEAIEQSVAGEQTFVGTIVPKRVSSVGSAVDGRVIEFPRNEGDRVKEGDALAQLLTGQLDIQLAGAKAELALRQDALEELKASWPEEVKQAEARYLSRKAAWEYASAKEARSRLLHQKGTISDETLQEDESQAIQASQAFAEAKSAWAVAQGPRKLAIAQAEQKVAVQEEEVNAIHDQINKHTIRSPFDGFVVEEFTEIGQWVAQAGLVAKVVELDEVDVQIMVVENYLSSLSLGTPARVEVPALAPSAGESKFEGRVAMIVPQADSRSRTFPVKVRLKNPERPDGQLLLKAGMLARVTLAVSYTDKAVLVPKDAVVLGKASPVVFVMDHASASKSDGGGVQSGEARPVNVELGIELNNLIQVKGDIKPHDLVVVQGNERLIPKENGKADVQYRINTPGA